MPDTARSFLASPEGVEHLNAAKKRLNLSTTAIAERATVSADTVRRLWHPERGKRVSRASVVAIATVLNLLPEDIVPEGEWQYDNPLVEAERRIQDALETNAKYLDLSRLGLTRVPEAIDQLTQLTRLFLDQNQLTSVLETLGNLGNLTELYLHQNQLTSVPETLGNLGNLTVLSLSQNQLTSVPETLGNLDNLTVLYLHQNQLTSVPESLGNLSNLAELYLYQNQLTSVPETLGNLSHLMELSLFQNQLTSVPETLGNLSSLTKLYLYQNQLTSVPETLGNLSKLTELCLFQNQLTSVPETLGNLDNLTVLYLHQNQLTSVPETLGNLGNLTVLSLSQNQLTSVPETLGNLDNLTVLSLHQNQLTSVPESLGNLGNLTELYLHQNQLTSVPETLGNLGNLTVLSLSQNQLTSVPETLGNLDNLTVLYLHQNQLTSVPETLGNLGNLTELALSQNQLTSVPETLGNLDNLTELALHQNQLTSVPESLGNLGNLTELYLHQNQLTSVPETLGNLGNLTVLSLSQNQLTSVPETLGNLGNLTVLYLHQNQLTSVPETLGNLGNLTTLDLDQNQLTSVPKTLGNLANLTELALSQNQLTSVPETLGNLGNLRKLHLPQNQLTSVPETLGNLANLTGLSLYQNQLTSVPETLGNLGNLTKLYLDQNQLTSVPGWIARLIRLERLDLNDNALTDLPAFLAELPHLQVLLLHGNEPLRLSDEILGPTDREINEGATPASPQAILDYYFRIQAERQPLNEAKLILVGSGNVGKTSLVNRLLHHTFDPDSKKTEGIQITPWHLRLHDTEDITLHVWDFGGQEIMHSTHQFFLTERSLYLLVLNGRQGHEDTDAEYWLELIQSFGGNSPVLVVLNKVQEHPFDVNRSALQQKFPNIHKFIATDCEANFGLDQLRAAIERETDQLEHLRDPFPASWVAIKQRLTDMPENYISFEHFRHVCQQDGETNFSAQDSLAIHLHSLGIALNYKDDPRLRDTHVLNPHWVTRGIYQLLNAHTLADTKGDLLIACLTQILDQTAYPPERHGFLLELMRKFELCVRYPEEEGHYLIPDLLDKQQPPIAEDFHPAECLNFRYEYPILPEGLLPRFIVRTHVLSTPQVRWRTGVILTLEGSQALVKADRADRCVTISINGTLNSRRRLLAVIWQNFESIHSSFKFKPQEKVPVPGHPNVAVNYNELLMREESGQTTFDLFTGKSLLPVNVRELLDGVDLDGIRKSTALSNKQKHALRLFYSYSHQDEGLRDELEVHLELLQHYGLIQNWHDRRIMPGADWQQELDTNLEQADIILLLVSPDFINSKYCFKREMTRALERHKAGEAMVVPILIRPVNWDMFQLTGLGINIQALPLDLKPITQWHDKDEAWLNVEQGIQRIIEEKMGSSLRELGRDRRSLGDFS